ncbi:hypothetical protein ACFE04_012060 [Oxalis oulophora]
MSMFLLGKSRMLAQGDFDQNLVQRGTEGFKHTIVEQDTVFRRQVHDLHQLYSVQKTLMHGSSSNNFDRFNSSKYAAQSYPIPLASSPSHQPSLMAPRSNQLRVQEIAEGRQNLYRNLQHRSLDLQLSADQYISMVDDDPLDLKLSLSLGERNRRKEFRNRTRFDRKTHIFPIAVIDLEESTLRKSNRSDIVVIDLEEESTEMSSVQDDAKPELSFGFAAPISKFAEKHERQVSDLSGQIILESVKKDPSLEIAESSCLVDDNGDHPKQNSLNGEYYGDVDWKNLLSKKKSVVSFEGGLFDLNKALPDESSSCYTTNPLAASSADDLKGPIGNFHGVSSSTISRENFNNCSHEISGLDVTNSCENDKPNELCAGEVSLTVSELKSSLDLREGHGSTHFESKKEDAAILFSGYGQNEGPDACGDTSPDSSKSRSVSDGDSCSVKTMQSGTHFGNGPNKQEPCKNNDLDQIDCVIQGAAESLIHILLSDAPSHYSATIESNEMEIDRFIEPNEMESEKIDQRQISIDSYELIAMNLTESNEDEYCVSSKPLEVKEPENRGYSSKLRRGRRLKDFQKDILPGLSSLSRHEIREDINLLEGVLRSREYRKMKGSEGGNWCSVTRSRRSRRRKLS